VQSNALNFLFIYHRFATDELTAPSMNEALFRCFLDFDKDFVQGGRNSSGSTACVVVWDARQCMLYVANTGDTRAVMSRSGNAIDLTFDR
jgi:serine/threonine protein phosphatase PrpC